VRFKVVKVSGVGLLALWKEKKVRLLYNSSVLLHVSSYFLSITGKAKVIIDSSDNRCAFGIYSSCCIAWLLEDII